MAAEVPPAHVGQADPAGQEGSLPLPWTSFQGCRVWEGVCSSERTPSVLTAASQASASVQGSAACRS